MTDKLISVIIPIYNCEKYIRQCLKSILQQSYTNFEIIVIDDGSKDNSTAVIKSCMQQDSRIRLVCQENAGVSRARNKGIEIAVGDIIVFIDADDWISFDFLERVSKEYDEEIDLLQFDYFLVEKATIRKHYFNESCIFEKNGNGNTVENLIHSIISPSLYPMSDSQYSVGVPWGKAYKKDIIIKNSIAFNEEISLNEDVLFNLQYLLYCTRIKYIAEPVYFYRKYEESSMKKLDKNFEKAISQRLRLLTEYDKFGRQYPMYAKGLVEKRIQLINESLLINRKYSKESIRKIVGEIRKIRIVSNIKCIKRYMKMLIKFDLVLLRNILS